MKKTIKISEVIATLKEKGLHKSAENVKKVIKEQEKVSGQKDPEAEEILDDVKDLLADIIAEIEGDEGKLVDLRQELEENVNNFSSTFDINTLERQFYKADNLLDKAVGQFKILQRLLKKY